MKEMQMFYMQEKLVESIQRDRHHEAQAARFNTLPNVRRTLRQRLVDSSPTIIKSMRRTPTATPPAAA